jgi:hypothetical protein
VIRAELATVYDYEHFNNISVLTVNESLESVSKYQIQNHMFQNRTTRLSFLRFKTIQPPLSQRLSRTIGFPRVSTIVFAQRTDRQPLRLNILMNAEYGIINIVIAIPDLRQSHIFKKFMPGCMKASSPRKHIIWGPFTASGSRSQVMTLKMCPTLTLSVPFFSSLGWSGSAPLMATQTPP